MPQTAHSPIRELTAADLDERPELAQRFGVRSIPTLAVFRDGLLLGTGVVGAHDLVAALDSAA